MFGENLKENQVMALKEKGIAAEFLSSTQTSQVRNKVKVYSFQSIKVIIISHGCVNLWIHEFFYA